MRAECSSSEAAHAAMALQEHPHHGLVPCQSCLSANLCASDTGPWRRPLRQESPCRALVLDERLAPVYVATAEALDDEMAARIAQHRRAPRCELAHDRGAARSGRCVAPRMCAGRAVLVDCLTLWLTNLMVAQRPVQADSARLVELLPTRPGGSSWSPTRSGSASSRPTPWRARSSITPDGCTRALPSGPMSWFSWRPACPSTSSRRRIADADACQDSDDRVTGFLGAGKTSLMRHLLRHAARPPHGDHRQRVRRASASTASCCSAAATQPAPTTTSSSWRMAASAARSPTISCRPCSACWPRVPPPDHIVVETSGPRPAEAAGEGVRLARDPHPRDGRRRDRGDRRGGRGEGRFAERPRRRSRPQRAADPALDHDNPLEEVFERPARLRRSGGPEQGRPGGRPARLALRSRARVRLGCARASSCVARRQRPGPAGGG